jgi:hypothetical protein
MLRKEVTEILTLQGMDELFQSCFLQPDKNKSSMINKAQQIIISAGQIHESERLYIYMYVCVRVRVC